MVKKEIVGFTAGNFDLLHPGYIITFEEAKRHCDRLLVFLQVDPSAHRKSKYKPVIPLYDRYKALMAIKYVDDVYTYQTEEEFYLPPKVIYTSRSHGWSTTMLKDLITKQTIKQNPEIVTKDLVELWDKKK